jgi:tRNA dimethylallyltransferase
MKYDAVLIAGPTASGKSAAALALASSMRGTVVNADSMQVYRELRVLTARPGIEDEARVPHLLYGHVPVTERYSAGRYQDDAASALADAKEAGRIPIFAGGTGLYFDVLTAGLAPIPPVPADLRAHVRATFEAVGRESFFAALVARDPAAANLRPSDTQRLLRAADVLEATGRPLSQWQAAKGRPVLEGLAIAHFVIAPSREILAERIAHRVETMFAHGALAEAAALAGLDPSLPAAKALGLPQLQRHLEGKIALEEATRETETATCQYAKRQMTWFRKRMEDWKWLEDDNASNIITQLKDYCL